MSLQGCSIIAVPQKLTNIGQLHLKDSGNWLRQTSFRERERERERKQKHRAIAFLVAEYERSESRISTFLLKKTFSQLNPVQILTHSYLLRIMLVE
jgi:hypothetical protein